MPATIAYTIQDEKGESSTAFLNIPTSFTIAQAIECAQDVGVLIDAVIGGQLTNIGLCYLVTLPGGIKATPDAGSDVEEGARFQFRTAANHLTRFRLPTFLEDLILAGTNTVDLADTDVDALVDAVVTGNAVAAGGGTTVTFTDARDEDITAIDAALESFQRSRS